jgi:hypothetical protein
MVSTPFHNRVSLAGISFDDFHVPAKLDANIVANDEGKALTVDTTAANKFKLAGNNDPIVARLIKFEDRDDRDGGNVGTVALMFAGLLPIAANQTVNVGDIVVGGATSGAVKALANLANAGPHDRAWVAEVRTGFAVVVKL